MRCGVGNGAHPQNLRHKLCGSDLADAVHGRYGIVFRQQLCQTQRLGTHGNQRVFCNALPRRRGDEELGILVLCQRGDMPSDIRVKAKRLGLTEVVPLV